MRSLFSLQFGRSLLRLWMPIMWVIAGQLLPCYNGVKDTRIHYRRSAPVLATYLSSALTTYRQHLWHDSESRSAWLRLLSNSGHMIDFMIALVAQPVVMLSTHAKSFLWEIDGELGGDGWGKWGWAGDCIQAVCWRACKAIPSDPPSYTFNGTELLAWVESNHCLGLKHHTLTGVTRPFSRAPFVRGRARPSALKRPEQEGKHIASFAIILWWLLLSDWQIGKIVMLVMRFILFEWKKSCCVGHTIKIISTTWLHINPYITQLPSGTVKEKKKTILIY